MARYFALLILFVLSFGSDAAAQFTFVAPNEQARYQSGATEATLTLKFGIWQHAPGPPQDTQGFSMGVAHDASLFEVIDFEYGEGVVVEPWGTPDFFAQNAHYGGWTCGVVYSHHGIWNIQFPLPAPVIEVTYATVTAPSVMANGNILSTSLTWSSALGIPSVQNIVIVAGASQQPTLQDGSLSLEPATYVRGDMNGDATINIADIFAAESYLFLSGPAPDCLAALDSNGDLAINLADIVHLLSYLFISGPEPMAPFPDCGVEPAGSTLGCEQYSCP